MHDDTTSPEAPIAHFVFGPVGVLLSPHQGRAYRADRPNGPTVTVRQNGDRIEVIALVSSETLGDIERVIVRASTSSLQTTLEELASIMLNVYQRDSFVVTSESLRAEGYLILWQSPEEAERHIATILPVKDGRRTLLEQDQLESTMEQVAKENLYDPKVLDILVEEEFVHGPCQALHENSEKNLQLIWRAKEGVWTAWRTPPPGDDNATNPMMEAVQPHLKSPLILSTIHEIVQILDLEEHLDQAQYSSGRETVKLALQGRSNYYDAWFACQRQMLDIEHFLNLGRFATKAASEHFLSTDLRTYAHPEPEESKDVGLRRIASLNEFEAQLLEHSLSRVVELAEIALARMKELLTDSMYRRADRAAYEKIQRRSADHPKHCLAAFKDAHIDSNLLEDIKDLILVPTQLRHMWTHRSREIDAEFFTGIGREGKTSETRVVLGKSREFLLGRRAEIYANDMQNFVWQLTEKLRSLAEALHSKWPSQQIDSTS